MKAKEFLEDLGFDERHLVQLFNDDDKSFYTIIEIMEAYAKAVLKQYLKEKK